MQGDKERTPTSAFTAAFNLIKVNKLITDLACNKTSARKLICFLVVAPATDNTVLLHKGHQGN